MIGGEKSFGQNEAIVMRNAATNVKELVIPNAGHWLMKNNTGYSRRDRRFPGNSLKIAGVLM
jgi:hypothetical protein